MSATVKVQEIHRLAEIVLKVAADDTAPTVDMPPLTVIINARGAVEDAQGDADKVKAALVGALAWIARRHWPEVATQIRDINKERMQ